MHSLYDLMIPQLSGNENDEFGKNKDARLPLLLPKAMEGRPVRSTSPLFCRLPPEILGDIMDLLANDKATLSALALVNSDCRQLACSCQFADVCFDYSPSSRLLLLQLTKEGLTRFGRNHPSNTTRPPFIGSCIRRVVVKSCAEWVRLAHSDLSNAIWGDAANRLDPEHLQTLAKKETDQYIEHYQVPLQAVMKLAMPHLEAVFWHKPPCLDGAFLGTVTNLPIRHLSLASAQAREMDRLEPPLVPLVVPLESLSLSVHLCTNERFHGSETGTDSDADAESRKNRGLSTFIQTLLQRCSTTLRRLTLSYTTSMGERSLSFDEDVSFPHLRYLDISGNICNPDARVWSSLFSAPLRHLSLPFVRSPAFKQVVSVCQPLRDLETLVISYLDGNDVEAVQSISRFISRHPHIRKLSIGDSTAHLMDSHLIPLLSDGRWSNLSSLSLVWNDSLVGLEPQPDMATISAHSLAVIGSIESLEQLSLSAGHQLGWYHQWLIDHNVVRSCLQGLARLERLALCRDTYALPDGASDFDAQRYYEDRRVTSAERNDALERPELDGGRDVENLAGGEGINDDPAADSAKVWERAHRNRMLREAERYAAVFPHLEWIYCGQWLMRIQTQQTSKGIVRVAMPLSTERDSCETFLDKMFAMRKDDE
jgi:hypothetical protein